jgi:hypothetical protein
MKKMTNNEWRMAGDRLSRFNGMVVFNTGPIQSLLTSILRSTATGDSSALTIN